MDHLARRRRESRGTSCTRSADGSWSSNRSYWTSGTNGALSSWQTGGTLLACSAWGSCETNGTGRADGAGWANRTRSARQSSGTRFTLRTSRASRTDGTRSSLSSRLTVHAVLSSRASETRCTFNQITSFSVRKVYHVFIYQAIQRVRGVRLCLERRPVHCGHLCQKHRAIQRVLEGLRGQEDLESLLRKKLLNRLRNRH